MIAKASLTILLFCSIAMAQGQTSYIPQFAAGGDQSLQILTRVTLVNLGTGVLNPARVDIETFDSDGNPASLLRRTTLAGIDSVEALEREIQGRGTAGLESHSADGTLRVGWARITTDDNIAVEVIFSIYDGQGRLLTTTSILPRPASASATLLVNVDSAGGLVGNLAALNPPDNGGTAVLDIDVYDSAGQLVGSAVVELAPGERVSRNWTEIVPALQGLNGFVGSAEVTSNLPVVMLSLRQEGVQLTTQEPLAARQ